MLQKQFENYLSSTGISAKSLKNYKSAISHFLFWAISNLKKFGTYIQNLTELAPFLTVEFVSKYKNYMVENSIPLKTVNRHLSTLRHLSRFLISSQILDFDFMDGTQNISNPIKKKAVNSFSLVDDFASHLEDQKISKNTIKNYASDIRQFLTWLESNHAHYS